MNKAESILAAKKLIKSILETAIGSLPKKDQVIVEFPISVDNYVLNHSKGSYLVLYKGGNFSEPYSGNLVDQDRDIQMGVVAVIRKTSGDKEPEEHIDFIIDAISGYEIENNREEKRIYSLADEWLKEENGIWWYMVIFKIPTDYLEPLARQ
jgi:hypothetical protein